MKSLVRFAVPAALVVCIACVAAIVGLAIQSALPTALASLAVLRIIISVVSLVAATWIVVIAGRSLTAQPAQQSAQLGTPTESASEYKPIPASARARRVRPLVGVPACGDLSLSKLSLDPRTRANIRKMRAKEVKRRAGAI